MNRLLHVGEPAPWFTGRTSSNPQFHFDTMAGRYLVLCFFQSTQRSDSRQILSDFEAQRSHFDDRNASFFGISIDPQDEERLCELLPGIRFFWDFDREISRKYGVVGTDDYGQEIYRAHTLLLDPRLRVLGLLRFDERPEAHVARVIDVLEHQPQPSAPVEAQVQAPVLVLPRVFEPDLCRHLIDYYERRGGEESGFMREVDGQTVLIHDASHKRRRDREVTDEILRRSCMYRIHDRVVPELHKAFQFRASRIERYIVACYDAESGGYFRPHRDNTTTGTAHRRFAVSLMLNPSDYEGGQLRFPEFGNQLYNAPLGGALVFSCALLHEALPVTQGKRYAFLPFLYDEAAAKIREENQGAGSTDRGSTMPGTTMTSG